MDERRMTRKEIQDKSNERRATSDEVPFSSNSIRLSAGQWIIVGIICLAAASLTPALWERYEKFSVDPDYRIPYDLSSDYWLYERYCRLVSSRNEILVIGDSVIWGHFVPKDKTLSHYLDEITDDTQFANLGLDGIHPAAMEGLLRYYSKDISNKNVILHFNPLWMSSPKQDLQGDKEFVFNHPKLVAQFRPKIPCYKASFSTRISTVLRRYIVLPNLLAHIKTTYFQNRDIPTWTIENPYKNPLKAITFDLPATPGQSPASPKRRPEAAKDEIQGTRDERRQTRDDGRSDNSYQWVGANTSFQWSCFRKTIKLLKQRGNQVFVLVGPFNEHLLEGTNLESYKNLKNDIELWLVANNIDYYAPPVLPAELYVDASHPTSKGYALLAQQLCENESFKSWILNSIRD
jgi:hypothetical protein